MKKTIHKIKESAKTHRRKLLYTLLVLTVFELIFVTATGSLKEVVDAVPEAILLSVISETLFMLGIVLMAVSSERSIGLNPLKWRSHLGELVQDIRKSKLFLVGFWLNFIGALGTGVIWFLVIILTLPPSGWFLLWIPFVDIVLTFALRKVFVDIVSLPIRRKRKTVEQSIDNSQDSLTI